MTLDQNDLRRRLRDRRRRLSDDERRSAALAVARHLAEWPALVGAGRIAGYWSCAGELDPAPVLEIVRAAGQAVYLPVLVDAPPKSLRFAPYRPDLPMRRNRFGIPEPDAPPAEWLPPEQMDLVLAPLVAVDATGTRLGMGGGFYDRSFAFLRDPAYRGRRPLLLGLGYAFQQTGERLLRQAWDVPLDGVVTEAGLHLCARADQTEKR